MKLLILGGTVFLGRHIAQTAIDRGYKLTLFNRGQHNPDLFPSAEKIYGDRAFDLDCLRDRRWDAVIDTCGYIPRIVKASATLLSGAVEHYTFISTISVYEDLSQSKINEESPIARLDDPSSEEITGDTYGPLKGLCERTVEAAMPRSTLNIRPGLIVGPFDPTDRFSYWPYRIAKGGEVLAPGSPSKNVQFIDVRDLAVWILDMAVARQIGVYNATGPGESLSMGQLLAACQTITESETRLTWVEEDFLIAHGVQQWIDLPLWLEAESYRGMMEIDIQKAINAGLRFRPLAETIADTLAWTKTRESDYQWRAGLTTEKQRSLLNSWHENRR